jgi:hypothetical protein
VSSHALIDARGTSDRDVATGPAAQAPTITPPNDDDVPARRLLAHDLEHIVWDHDGEAPVPPPD